MTLEALDLEPFGFLPLAGGGGDGGDGGGGDASGDGGGDASGDGGGPGGGDDSGGDFGGFGDYGSGSTGYGATQGETGGFDTGSYGTADDNYGGTVSDDSGSGASPSGTGVAAGRSTGRGGPTAAAVNAMNALGVHSGTQADFSAALGKAASTGLSGKVAGGALGLMGALTPGVTGTGIGLAGKTTGNFGLNTHGATWGDVFSQSVPAGVTAMGAALGVPEAEVEAAMEAYNEAAGLNADQQPTVEPGGPDDYQAGGRYDPNRFMPKTGLAAPSGAATPAAPAAPKTVGGLYVPPVPDYVKRYASGAWGGPTG